MRGASFFWVGFIGSFIFFFQTSQHCCERLFVCQRKPQIADIIVSVVSDEIISANKGIDEILDAYNAKYSRKGVSLDKRKSRTMLVSNAMYCKKP